MISNQLEVVTALWFKFPNMICHMTMFCKFESFCALPRYATWLFNQARYWYDSSFSTIKTASHHPSYTLTTTHNTSKIP